MAHEHPLIFQGPTGTVLSDGGEMTDYLLISDFSRVADMHRCYASAGADVLITHTFNSKTGDMASMTEADVKALNSRGVEAARLAGNKMIAGCIGPCRSSESGAEAVARQAEVLLDNGVDFILFDSLYSPESVSAAVAGIRAVESRRQREAKIIFSFCASDVGTLECMWREMDGAEADYVGLNCIYPPSAMTDMAQRLYELSGKSGVYRPACRLREMYTAPCELAGELKRLVERVPVYGVGACCGGTYSHISELKKEF